MKSNMLPIELKMYSIHIAMALRVTHLIFWLGNLSIPLAQLVAHWTSNPKVPGLIPVQETKI